MSHEAWCTWLFQVGTGWLGWSARDTLAAPVPAILIAYEGRTDMLTAIFGGKRDRRRLSDGDDTTGRPASPAGFQAAMAALGIQAVKD